MNRAGEHALRSRASGPNARCERNPLGTTRLVALVALLLAACSAPSLPDSGEGDAGSGGGAGGGDSGEVDAGPSVPCSGPAGCRAVADAVCRQNVCTKNVPCQDDVECGLGEQCFGGRCTFTGCAADADCPSKKCRTDVFACAECGSNDACPSTRPVCDTTSNKCVNCGSDADCTGQGPAHCDKVAGACVHCLENTHCPNGLTCAANHTCVGEIENGACPMGVSCGAGLTCVNVGAQPTCLRACSLYTPACKSNEICYKLTFSSSASLVFDATGPLGVCFTPQNGLRGVNEPCQRNGASSNCQPNLVCIPESPTLSLCRKFCNPNASGTCTGTDKCHAFSGDYQGRRYGLCYPDNGWGDPCSVDATCRTNQVCLPYDDPSETEQLSGVCHFAVGMAPGMAACTPQLLPDGGTLSADRVCQSGACRADPTLAPTATPYQCFESCKVDGDCTQGARRGYCDGAYTFPSSAGPGEVPGCRPRCDAQSDCAEYPATVKCAAKLVTGYQGSYRQTCSPIPGSLGPGAPCTTDSTCRSGLCLKVDGRDVPRQGYCATPCKVPNDCVPTLADGGVADAGVSFTGPLECKSTAFMGFRGFDGTVFTADDRIEVASLCSGVSCSSNADCGANAVCAPDADPSDAGFALTLRCRPVATVGNKVAGDACSDDSECRSGACGTLQAPSVGGGRACFEACSGATVCPGSTTCRAAGMRFNVRGGSQSFDSCAP